MDDRQIQSTDVASGGVAEPEMPAAMPPDRYRRLVENSLGLICAHDLAGNLLFVNSAAARALGYAPEEGIGRKLVEFLAPSTRHLFAAYLARIRENRVDEGLMRVIDRLGRERVWMYRNTRSEEAGERPFVIGHAIDITERVALEQSLRMGEQEIRNAFSALELRFQERTDDLVAVNTGMREQILERQRERTRWGEPAPESNDHVHQLVDAAPVMLWVAGADGRRTYFNRRWVEFTGCSPDPASNRDWLDSVHPDDRPRLVAACTLAQSRRESFRIEYRLRRHDGELRWVLDAGAPRIAADAAFDGYIGSCIDISEHKGFQEVLGKLSRRLMDAQEQERAWIARELRDDFAQRAVGLAMQLHNFAQGAGRTTTGHDPVQEMGALAARLGRDIHAVSGRLHSAPLEYLGLESAAIDFCSDLSVERGVAITCRVEGVPSNMPKKVALVLFRVLQEAVLNAVNHSGDEHIQVALRGAAGEIQLEVIDRGRGFDPRDPATANGLGLLSMRERLNVIGGEIAVESKPGAGTQVRVRVPV
jgi:PAS domain S-box-containing protein